MTHDGHQLHKFQERLRRIGIDTRLSGNIPWIYLKEVNGVSVSELFMAEHGFTVYFTTTKLDCPGHFTDLRRIFKLIRSKLNT